MGPFYWQLFSSWKIGSCVCRLIANKDQKTLLYQTVWIICRPNIPWSFSAGNKPAPHLREMVMFSHPPYAKCLPDSVCQNVQPPAAKIPPPLNPIDGTGYQVSSIVCPPHHPTLLPPSHSSQHTDHAFTITEKAPNWAFSWMKAPTSAFTFKTLC